MPHPGHARGLVSFNVEGRHPLDMRGKGERFGDGYVRPYAGSTRVPGVHPLVWAVMNETHKQLLIDEYLDSLGPHPDAAPALRSPSWPSDDSQPRPPPTPRLSSARKPRALDLCSGAGSMAAVLKSRGWEVHTVDFDPRRNPDFCSSLKDFRPTGRYDYVHASPPCGELSIANNSGKRNFAEALDNIRHIQRIIKQARAVCYTVGNPSSGYFHSIAAYLGLGGCPQAPHVLQVWFPLPQSNMLLN